ncbi:pleckstrin homology domain-containing family A member 1 isoform X2 [Nematostella vectensis]|uniref:pleckstrin homology domain-containing family A member 1 isoform X2 n=1 Tax=Nematostella vectensis TaxID=45351 RepID=UPI002077214C|nr:pleckstrin homology domain-containing family A member 1 isoform X2 [Nematostella vectensis]XP_048584819.1 pleckstrin homology domain-containing family A member 1 isoform X2 [Nematostella vectensis]
MLHRDEYSRLLGSLYLKDQNEDWKNKLFILDEEQCLLRYFHHTYVYCPPNEKLWNMPEGEIKLRFITKIEERPYSPENGYCFEIQMFDAKKYFLKSEKEKEMQEWVTNLRRVAVDPTRRQQKGSISKQIDNPPPEDPQPIPTDTEEVTNGKDKPMEHISYETKIVGGVVIRKPVVMVDPTRRQQKGSISKQIDNPPPEDPQPIPTDTEEVTNGKDKPMEHISYETNIVGGVVIRKPVVMKADSDTESQASLDSQGSSFSESVAGTRGIKVIKDGYLVKKGAVVKNWKKRYFKLDLVKFSYYEKDTDRDPIRTIPTVDISEARVSKIVDGGTKEHMFEVVTPHRTFYLQAYTDADMQSWIKALHSAIKSIRGRTASGPL